MLGDCQLIHSLRVKNPSHFYNCVVLPINSSFTLVVLPKPTVMLVCACWWV